MNPVVHFEFPVEDRDRAATFYKKAFAWKTQMLGAEMGNYTIATTTETDENGHPQKPGRINGGFFLKSTERPAQYPSVVIAVDKIRESMKRVAEAGGKVLGEPVEIPGYGQYVSFLDTEGNRVAMIEPLESMKESAA